MSIIFFDIDGTVMDLDGTIPPSAVTAVRRLRQAGHHCVINTGRPKLAMDPQLMDMDFDGLVCSCGQYIQLDGKIIRHIAGHTEAIDAAKRAGDYYSLYRVEGSAFGDFSCYRVGHAPYNGTLYLPAGFHDYGIATVDELFVALVVGRCEFLCEYQDEIDEVYHGLFEKRI